MKLVINISSRRWDIIQTTRRGGSLLNTTAISKITLV